MASSRGGRTHLLLDYARVIPCAWAKSGCTMRGFPSQHGEGQSIEAIIRGTFHHSWCPVFEWKVMSLTQASRGFDLDLCKRISPFFFAPCEESDSDAAWIFFFSIRAVGLSLTGWESYTQKKIGGILDSRSHGIKHPMNRGPRCFGTQTRERTNAVTAAQHTCVEIQQLFNKI